MSRDTGTGFFTGLMIGAVIGLAVGFLYAPQPGVETRRVVKDKLSTVKENASRAAARIRQRVQQRMAEEQESTGEGE